MWKKGREGNILGYKNVGAFTAASIQNTLYFLNIYIFRCNTAPLPSQSARLSDV